MLYSKNEGKVIVLRILQIGQGARNGRLPRCENCIPIMLHTWSGFRIVKLREPEVEVGSQKGGSSPEAEPGNLRTIPLFGCQVSRERLVQKQFP